MTVTAGLLPPAAPRVKVSNLMQVMGTDAVLLPTQVEGVVKQQVWHATMRCANSLPAQVSLRQEKHLEANNARALTKDEKKAKDERKLLKGCDVQIHVAAFRFTSRERNAAIDCLTQRDGLVVCGAQVQGDQERRADEADRLRNHRQRRESHCGGGRRQGHAHVQAVRTLTHSATLHCALRRLMLHRIKWNDTDSKKAAEEGDDADEASADEDAAATNKCSLMWEVSSLSCCAVPQRRQGTIKYRQFAKFELKVIRNDVCHTILLACRLMSRRMRCVSTCSSLARCTSGTWRSPRPSSRSRRSPISSALYACTMIEVTIGQRLRTRRA